jgi:hypothetical protein
MSLQKPISIKIFLAVLSCLGWFALITQLYLNISSHQVSVPESITRYFSYFTLLTNLIVAVYCTVLWLAPNSRQGIFFSRTQTGTAITVYITIVAMIYNIVLRSLWQPQGLQKVLDQLLHTIIPVLFILYWCVFVKKHTLQWKDFLPWLWYPFIYLAFVLIRGTFSGFYPYPFIHVGEIGMQQTLINAVGIGILFMVISLVFIGIGKLWSRSA